MNSNKREFVDSAGLSVTYSGPWYNDYTFIL